MIFGFIPLPAKQTMASLLDDSLLNAPNFYGSRMLLDIEEGIKEADCEEFAPDEEVDRFFAKYEG